MRAKQHRRFASDRLFRPDPEDVADAVYFDIKPGAFQPGDQQIAAGAVRIRSGEPRQSAILPPDLTQFANAPEHALAIDGSKAHADVSMR